MAGKGGLRSTSFGAGNTAALGNDKTLRWTTLIEQEMDRPLGDVSTLEGYEAELSYRHAVARKYVRGLLTEGDLEDLRKFLEGRIDREDGKAQNRTDLTSNGDAIQPVLVRFIGEDDAA